MNRLLFLFLLSLFQPSAFAAIYKCEGTDGKAQYQGMPCDRGSQLNIKRGAALPAATPKAAPKTNNTVAPNGSTTVKGTDSREKQCVGKELRISFTNMPVMTTLHVLADFSANRLEADPSITGGGAFYYDCAPWETVLQDIAAKYKLSAKVAGGVIYVIKR